MKIGDVMKNRSVNAAHCDAITRMIRCLNSCAMEGGKGSRSPLCIMTRIVEPPDWISRSRCDVPHHPIQLPFRIPLILNITSDNLVAFQGSNSRTALPPSVRTGAVP